MTANRTAGLFIVCVAALFWLLIIPYHSSSSSSGWMRPRTLPTLCAASLIILGLLLAMLPKGKVTLAPVEIFRFFCVLVMAVATLWGMSRFGFLATGPVFVVALMVFAGERRLGWLISGAFVAPVLIWFIASVLLGRPLP